MRWIGICDGNMQEGSFRCDANVSVRPLGSDTLGTRCEIKNLNSFRFMQEAIEFEVRRQIELIEDGGTVVQETRLYDPDRHETRSMRSKEDAQDYRYFPDPDLPPLVIGEDWIARVQAAMPELPEATSARFVEEDGLVPETARQLVNSRAMADYYEATVQAGVDTKLAANWIVGDLSAALHKSELDIAQSPVSSDQLAGLLKRIADGTISGKIAKDVFDEMCKESASRSVTIDGQILEAKAGLVSGIVTADQIIEAKGLRQISDEGAIATIVDDAIAANPAIVAEYKAGREKAFNALVGKVMAASKGKANPAQVNAILRNRLG